MCENMKNLRDHKGSFSLYNVNFLHNASLQFPTIDSAKIRTFNLKDVIILDSVFVAFLRELNFLETLELYNMQIIFDFLYTPSIESLSLASHDIRAYKSIKTFLSEVNALKKLEINAMSCDIMEFFQFTSFNFSLKHLILRTSGTSIGYINTNNDDNFLEFIKGHIGSLTVLEMRAILSPRCLDFLITKLRTLRSLELKVNFLIGDVKMCSTSKPRKSVKHVLLDGPFQKPEAIISLLSLYPSVKQLYFSDVNHLALNLNFMGDVLEFAARSCPEIQDLSINRMPLFNQNIIFEKLEVLRVGYINEWKDLINYLKINKSVQTLHVEYIFRHQMTKESIEALLSSQIRHFHVTADVWEIKKVFDHIDTIGHGNLATLELIIDATELNSYSFKFAPGHSNKITADALQFDINGIIMNELVEYLEEEGIKVLD